MMIEKEALERTVNYIERQAKDERLYSSKDENLDFAETIKKALEKQIPKKPIPSEKRHIRYSMNYTCPSCGKEFSGTGIADYCYHCGQKILWEEEEC